MAGPDRVGYIRELDVLSRTAQTRPQFLRSAAVHERVPARSGDLNAVARIGLLTGGGDCPGLNAVIRAVVRRGLAEGGHDFVGFRHGWAGVLANDAVELTAESTSGILPRGGTILGTSRTNPYADGDGGT